MERFFIFLCLAVLYVQALEPGNLTVAFSDLTPRRLQVGDTDVSFICSVNRGILFLFKNNLHLIHVDLDGRETLLFKGLAPEEAKPSLYTLEKLDIPVPHFNESFIFTILTVRDEDQGFLKCRVSVADGDTSESQMAIILLRPMTQLKMKFDILPIVRITQQNPFEVDVGKYSIKCVTLGSNPAVEDFKLYVDDNVTKALITKMEMEDPPHRYKVTLEADVDIKADTKLECVANQPFQVTGDTPDRMSISVPIKVNQYDPDVHCNTTGAYPGMMYPRLICVVDHQDMNIKEFKYFIKSTGQEIRVGEETSEFNVKSEKLSPHKTKVILDLYKAEGWHFDTEFFLKVKNSQGQEFQFPVKLNRIEGPSDSGSVLQASMTPLLLSALITVLLQLK